MKWWMRLHNYRMEYKLLLFSRRQRIGTFFLTERSSYYKEYYKPESMKGVSQWVYPKQKM